MTGLIEYLLLIYFDSQRAIATSDSLIGLHNRKVEDIMLFNFLNNAIFDLTSHRYSLSPSIYSGTIILAGTTHSSN